METRFHRRALSSLAIVSLIAVSLQDASAATWPDAMLELRAEVTANRRETEEASDRQGLDNLHCSPWHDFELAIFREMGLDAWPYETKPVHEYDSAVEQAFKRDGLIDLEKEYLSADNCLSAQEGLLGELNRPGRCRTEMVWIDRSGNLGKVGGKLPVRGGLDVDLDVTGWVCKRRSDLQSDPTHAGCSG